MKILETELEMEGEEQEMEQHKVEKLRRLLPTRQEKELSQLDIILQAINYIESLQQDLSQPGQKSAPNTNL